jgi:hypothetical protein
MREQMMAIWHVSIELPMPTFEGDAMSVKEFMEYNAKLNKIYEDIDYSRESKLETRL